MPSIYQLKPRFQNLLRPGVQRLYARGVTANQVTLAAAAVSVLLGALLAWLPHYTWLFALIPLWMLSGALFPASGAFPWIRWVMRVNPLTYGVELVRRGLFPAAAAGDFSTEAGLVVLLTFCIAMFVIAYGEASRRTTRPGA